MTTDMILAVFADFNELNEEPAEEPVEDVPSPQGDIDEIRTEAWTDGYMTGRQERGPAEGEANLTAKLLTSVHELDTRASEAVNAASLAVADLLVNAIVAATSDDWSSRLLDRVRLVADRIKPALTVAPEFVLRDDAGTVRRFGDISELSRALEAGSSGKDVTIHWQRGEATISHTALLEDLRDAMIPLSAGLANEQNARHQT